MNDKFPLISIITPTFNSGKTIEKTLKSIRKQTYPQERIEIMIIDGGSRDDTVKIAKKYKCRVIPNLKIDIINAGHLGYTKAKGKYYLGLAPDEVLENPNSLKLKISAFRKDPNIRAVIASGYKTPENMSSINHYINEFGDPFSLFYYRESSEYTRQLSSFKKKYEVIREDKNCAVFSFNNTEKLPPIELWGGGNMLDLKFVRKTFPEVKINPSLIPLLFFLINTKSKLLAITKNDPTVHFSCNNLKHYLKKIKSRVEFNIFRTPMGMGGFSGRENIVKSSFKLRKYFFLFYSISIILPFLDSVILSVSRKQIVYMLHLPLSIYTSFLIGYYYLVKVFDIEHNIKLYGH